MRILACCQNSREHMEDDVSSFRAAALETRAHLLFCVKGMFITVAQGYLFCVFQLYFLSLHHLHCPLESFSMVCLLGSIVDIQPALGFQNLSTQSAVVGRGCQACCAHWQTCAQRAFICLLFSSYSLDHRLILETWPMAVIFTAHFSSSSYISQMFFFL